MTAPDTTLGSVRPTRWRGGRRLGDGSTVYWWTEIGFVLAYYAIYSAIRNHNTADASLAFQHARSLIELQHRLGLYHEATIQAWALHARPLIIAANYFYGSLHFVVTIGVGVFLFRRWTDDYPFWRNTLAIATATALIGFTFWPLMPPRLLPASYGFVDTLAKYPTLWTFNSGALHNISNQYAAMPSVHCCWALWCACALVPRLRTTWGKALAALYPVCTVIVIVITGNHYVLDAVAGFAILGFGYVVSRLVTRAGRRPAPTPA